ncbi:hypothetical protein HDU76_012569 [Blyttiomyces sp. JEL0837]|nr:hypothetical protein HDU76_012569 [Blyttiomyces sp. JEL0837]
MDNRSLMDDEVLAIRQDHYDDSIRLRCRSSKGQIPVGANLTPQSTLRDLKQNIESVLSIPFANLIRFPPKPLTASDETSLETCGVKDGDQLVVEEQQLPQYATSLPPAAERIGASGIPAVHSSDVEDAQLQAALAMSLEEAAPKPSSPIKTSTSSSSKSKASESCPLGDGVLVVREMEDDNSCLFRSIGYIFERDVTISAKLRQIIVTAINNNPIEYNEAILGRPVPAYCNWISNPTSWGGAIELAIFATHYQTEIVSIDISTLRADRFGQGMQYPRVAYVMYSGIHYDAVALMPAAEAPEEFDVTTFERGVEDERVSKGVLGLGAVLKKKKKFTDLANFTLKCGVCMEGLKGQKEAQAHALDTGHTSFTEYS